MISNTDVYDHNIPIVMSFNQPVEQVTESYLPNQYLRQMGEFEVVSLLILTKLQVILLIVLSLFHAPVLRQVMLSSQPSSRHFVGGGGGALKCITKLSPVTNIFQKQICTPKIIT